jgi:NCAIR mutase (PurE)-related protein
MDALDLNQLLQDVRDGAVEIDDAAKTLRRLPFADLGFARVDHHRVLRQGLPEAIYAPGKTPAQCAGIVSEMLESGLGPVLLTRADELQVAAALLVDGSGNVVPSARPVTTHAVVSWRPAPLNGHRAVVVTAGTADLPVADECVATLRAYGIAATLLADCGVAGLHRLLASLDDLSAADAVVVVAGMEGALSSVVGGLTSAPVVAVPTSVGYGSGFEGVTALLAMLASCAAGMVVVGIDNGYGAACAVARILR